MVWICASYDLKDLFIAKIGVIFQDFMRYEMTARENIAVGQIRHRISQPFCAPAFCAEKSLANEVAWRDCTAGLRPDAGPPL